MYLDSLLQLPVLLLPACNVALPPWLVKLKKSLLVRLHRAHQLVQVAQLVLEGLAVLPPFHPLRLVYVLKLLHCLLVRFVEQLLFYFKIIQIKIKSVLVLQLNPQQVPYFYHVRVNKFHVVHYIIMLLIFLNRGC